MNIRIIFSILLVHIGLQSHSQTNMPCVREISFEEVAARFNTHNDKRAPMTFLSGFSVEGDAKSLTKNPVQVMFNPIANVQRADCELMRWDPVTRVWAKFSGNQLKKSSEGSKMFWSAGIDQSGIFALMKEIPLHGETNLHLPEGLTSEEWRYVQPNLGVVCESYSHCQTLLIPLPALSPMAQITMKLRKVGGTVETISHMPMGVLVGDFWKKPDAVNQTWDISFASVK